MLGLRCCARAFSSCGERGLLFVAVRGLINAVASLVAERGLSSARASVVVVQGLSSSGSRALERACHNYRALMPQLLKPACLEPMLRDKRSHRNEKPSHRNEE